jgi:hypothetical protein
MSVHDVEKQARKKTKVECFLFYCIQKRMKTTKLRAEINLLALTYFLSFSAEGGRVSSNVNAKSLIL